MKNNPIAGSSVHIVDDDAALRDSLVMLFNAHGISTREHESAEKFLTVIDIAERGCALIDVNMPGMSGIELLAVLKAKGSLLSCIVMTGSGQVPIAVKAMKAGAVDFVEKPFEQDVLIESVKHFLENTVDEGVNEKLARLTPRERDVMIGIANGKQNKVIALDLGISPRTVEIHRAHVLAKLEAEGVADVVKFSLAAGLSVTS